jgi:hypothetical protein
MTTHVRPRRWPALAGAALLLLAGPVIAEDNLWSPDNYRSGGQTSSGARSDSYAYSGNDSYSGSGGGYGGGSYARSRDSYAGSSGGNDAYAPSRGGYGGGSGDAYSPSQGGGGYGNNDAYSPRNDAYSPRNDAYSPRGGYDDSYSDPGRPVDDGGRGGYGEPYAPPGQEAYRDGPPPPRDDDSRYYSQNEIVAAGHGFFGAISQGLGKAVEYAFQSQGRPNGYILGEDAGGAFLLGLRYGEGRLYTKDAGDHKVYWQGPSVGYDAGAEGSKTMVLVYNLSDPSEIYNRFGGVQGAAYLVGGLSVQFQKYGDVTLAVIRSGVGVRLGANVGYLKYTRAPTWNPL